MVEIHACRFHVHSICNLDCLKCKVFILRISELQSLNLKHTALKSLKLLCKDDTQKWGIYSNYSDNLRMLTLSRGGQQVCFAQWIVGDNPMLVVKKRNRQFLKLSVSFYALSAVNYYKLSCRNFHFAFCMDQFCHTSATPWPWPGYNCKL